MINREEVWRDIAGYEGIYQVSNLGNVRSLDRWIKRITNKVVPNLVGGYMVKGKNVAKTNNGNGYFIASLSNGGRKNHYVHRLVAEAFIDNPLHKLQVNHKDGNKSNNHKDNLEWVTGSENNKHAHKTGLQPHRSQLQHAIKVLNIETNQVFGTIKEASEYYGIKYGLLKEALRRPTDNRRHPIYKSLRYHHQHIETHPEEAKKLGLSFDRLSNY